MIGAAVIRIRPAQPDLLASSKGQATEGGREKGAVGAKVSIQRTWAAGCNRAGEIKRIEVCPSTGIQACCSQLILEVNSLCTRSTIAPLLASVIDVQSADRAARVIEEARPPEEVAGSGIARANGAEGAIGAACCSIAIQVAGSAAAIIGDD